MRKCLDDLVGRRIETKTEADTEVRNLKSALDTGELVAIVTGTDARGRKQIGVQGAGVGKSGAAEHALTLGQLLDEYDKHYLSVKRASMENERLQIDVIKRTLVDRPGLAERPFEEWRAGEIAALALDRFHAIRSVRSQRTSKVGMGRTVMRSQGGKVTANRNLALIRAAFNWGIRGELLERTPFKRGTETVVKLTREDSRRRRLEGDEAERPLGACDPLRLNPRTKQPMPKQSPPRLRPIVEAALETGCRSGELLSLQWSQVKRLEGRKPELYLPAGKTKTRRNRNIPISSRLKAILEMRRNDADGEPHGPQAFVFGNEIGQRTLSIKTAWKLACRRAGIEDLHFHDLRREAGSRWLEGGVPLQTVRDWLGHTNISQTSTYLESTLKGQHEAMERFELQRGGANGSGVQPGETGGGNQGHKPPSDDTTANTNTRETIN